MEKNNIKAGISDSKFNMCTLVKPGSEVNKALSPGLETKVFDNVSMKDAVDFTMITNELSK